MCVRQTYSEMLLRIPLNTNRCGATITCLHSDCVTKFPAALVVDDTDLRLRGLRPTAGDTSHKADSMFVRHLASQPLVQNAGAIVEERCRPKRFVRAGNHIAPGCSAIHSPGAMCHSKLLGEVGYAYVGDLQPATSSVLRNITFSPADPRSLLPESDDLRCYAGSGFTGRLVSGVRTGSPREGTRLVDRCSLRQGQPGSASDLEAAVRHRSCSRSRLERLPRFGESPRCRRRCMRCGA